MENWVNIGVILWGMLYVMFVLQEFLMGKAAANLLAMARVIGAPNIEHTFVEPEAFCLMVKPWFPAVYDL